MIGRLLLCCIALSLAQEKNPNELYHQFLQQKRPPVKVWRTPAPLPAAVNNNNVADKAVPGRKSLLKPWIQSPNDPVFRNTDEFYADVKLSEAQRNAVAAHRQSMDLMRRDRHSNALQRALDEYSKRHDAALAQPGAWKDAAHRFVIWRCASTSTPIGEQMESLVSAFLLAMLTNRVLVAYGPIVPFFESPFAAGWSLEHEVFYTRPDQPDVLETKIYSNTARTELQIFACGDPRNVTQKVWRVSSAYFFALSLARNPRFRAQVLQWFPTTTNASEAQNMFAPLADFLFAVPIRSVERRVRVFEEHYYGNVGSTIGLHLRLPRTSTPDEFDVEELATRVARCVDVAVMPRMKKLKQRPIFFVASAYFDAKTLMSRAFSKEAIVTFNEHNDAAATTPQSTKNETAAMEAALVEWHLLSRTHDMIISYATPFARTAAAIAEVAPVVVDHESLSCARLNTTDMDLIASEEYWMRPSSIQCAS